MHRACAPRHDRVQVVAASAGSFYGQPMTAGDIYTIAGNGTPGFTGDGGPATSASPQPARGIALTGTGQVIVADMSNNRTRVISAEAKARPGPAI